jgi:uncharacterized protein YegJ (DUF2314 family)
MIYKITAQAARLCCAGLAAALLLCGLAGCGGDDGATIEISEDDPELIYARQNARSTIGQFIYALQSPRAGQTLFAVKAKFIDGDDVEYMWLTDLRYENGDFLGVVNNEPSVVSNVRMGQEYRVSAYEIDDWMILDNEQIVGGYSVNIVASRQEANTNYR